MTKRTNGVVLLIIMQGLMLCSSNAMAAKSDPIEIFTSMKGTACHQEVSLELGNVWTLCGPYRFKDYEMDRIRLVYTKNAGTKRDLNSNVITFADLESGKLIGVSFPPERKGEKGVYYSFWNKAMKEIEEVREKGQKAREEIERKAERKAIK